MPPFATAVLGQRPAWASDARALNGGQQMDACTAHESKMAKL